MQDEEEDIPPHINDPYVEDVDDGHEVEPREMLTSIMPRVAGHVDVDKILTGLSESRVTHKHLTNFCAHFSFVSSVEPLKVQDALMDKLARCYERRVEQFLTQPSVVISQEANYEAQCHWNKMDFQEQAR